MHSTGVSRLPAHFGPTDFRVDLDGVYLRYSYKFPTLLTLVVDPNDATPNSAASSPGKDPQEWRLASADPRDHGQMKYRLHTLDIYFWTLEDAKGVIETVRRILRPQQLDILDAPRTSSHGQEHMSPVVQQLEKVAITDPAYRNGQTRNSQNQGAALPPAPPPPPALASSRQSPSSPAGSNARPASVKSSDMPTGFSPIAYNPASPAAPEPFTHREKTPPPADGADGTGLAAAASADYNQIYTSAHPQPYSAVPGQPPSISGRYGSPSPHPGPEPYGPPPPHSAYNSPPPAQNFPQTSSVTSINSQRQPAPPSNATSPAHRQALTPQPGYAPPPQDPNTHLYGGGVGSATQPGMPVTQSQPRLGPSPPQDPNAHFYSSQAQLLPAESPAAQIYGSLALAAQPHQPVPHRRPQYANYLQSHLSPPPSGYPQYDYAQQHPHHQHHHHHHHDGDGNPYDVHNQLYRPTEEEDRHKHNKGSTAGRHAGTGHNKQAGRLEETAGKMDSKINSFLEKLGKRL